MLVALDIRVQDNQLFWSDVILHKMDLDHHGPGPHGLGPHGPGPDVAGPHGPSPHEQQGPYGTALMG